MYKNGFLCREFEKLPMGIIFLSVNPRKRREKCIIIKLKYAE